MTCNYNSSTNTRIFNTNKKNLFNCNKFNNNPVKMYSKSTPLLFQLFSLKRSKTVQHFHLPPFRLNNNEKLKMVIFLI